MSRLYLQYGLRLSFSVQLEITKNTITIDITMGDNTITGIIIVIVNFYDF